ncbi:hypothetical protein NPIL_540331 [Nephila pilipes]|uniref:Uncharacterized protein n=1 Tax=Nephila pilipes TaxID=299642 RepID=A0A8X6PQ87_NEPPI|nr:hypothetical protein NPIL_540331 [Nephila pilipes]
MQRLSPPTIRHHGHKTIIVSNMQPYFSADRLHEKKCLQPPYEGLYKIVNRIEKMFRILRHGKEVSVSVDWLKPVYVTFPKSW